MERNKEGTKRTVIVEAVGGSLGVVVTGANIHDGNLLEATSASIVVRLPALELSRQHLCLDRGFGNPSGERAATVAGYAVHIRRIGEEKLDETIPKKHPVRRWVVARTLVWLSACRAILARYKKGSSNYLGLFMIACILQWYRRAHRLRVVR